MIALCLIEARRLHFYFHQEPNSRRCAFRVCVWKVACQQKQFRGPRPSLSFSFWQIKQLPHLSSSLFKQTNAEAVNGVSLLTCGKKTRVNWTQYYLLSHLFALCPWFCWRRVCAPVQTDKSARRCYNLSALLPRRVVTRNLRRQGKRKTDVFGWQKKCFVFDFCLVSWPYKKVAIFMK